MRVKVSLEAIIAQTKISRRFLEAIENGEYGELPGGVFDVSYIRQYAALIGYDAETILEDYRRVSGVVEPGGPPSQAERNEPRWVRFFEFG
ncbi:MAG: helix-turn-helix domain-containing protein [Bryobacteraceae bacterium]|jgi:cytoskeletal protein RodZ|nr:helix-turn-helix domain-containing protein [Bryobacteraceae bacterium]